MAKALQRLSKLSWQSTSNPTRLPRLRNYQPVAEPLCFHYKMDDVTGRSWLLSLLRRNGQGPSAPVHAWHTSCHDNRNEPGSQFLDVSACGYLIDHRSAKHCIWTA